MSSQKREHQAMGLGGAGGSSMVTTCACLWGLDPFVCPSVRLSISRRRFYVLGLYVGTENMTCLQDLFHFFLLLRMLLALLFANNCSFSSVGILAWYSMETLERGPGIPRLAFFLIILKLWHLYAHVGWWKHAWICIFQFAAVFVRIVFMCFLRLGMK